VIPAGSARLPLISAVGCLIILLAAIPLWGSAPRAVAAPAQTEIVLQDITPVSVAPGKVLRISGRFVTDSTLKNVRLRLEIGTSRFLSRSALTEAAASPPPDTTIVNGAVDELGKVDANRRFRINVDTDELAPLLTAGAGVYPLKVVATAGALNETVASVSTFLPWAPEGPKASRLLFIWPLIDQPRRDATGTFTIPGLGEELRRGGRLATLTASGQGAPVTWVIDPSVLSDVAALDTAPARRWLADLPAAIGDQETVIVPFGDPDIAAVTAADQIRLLRRATRHGEDVAEELLAPREVRTDFAWPADGAADEVTIDRARREGTGVMLLDETTAPLITPPTYTPSGRIEQVDPDVQLLLSDRPASALVASPARTRDDVVLGQQRFLAETLLHSLEAPNDPRLLVLSPPRRWDPDPKWARALVTATEQATWLNPVTIEQALTPGAPVVDRAEPTIPEPSAERQVPRELILAASEAQPLARRFHAILTRPAVLAQPIEDAIYTSISTAWRTDHEAAAESQARTLERLRTQRGKVRIVSRGGTLSDDRGELPITIRNQLDQRVEVRLSATSPDPLRLRVQAPDGLIRVEADGVESVGVGLDAVTSGRLTVDAQILTPKGKPYAESVQLNVDVRAYGRIAIFVFGAAAALMIAAAFVRIVRRIRNRNGRTA
jgi:Family of unknown function (DUF6049)